MKELFYYTIFAIILYFVLIAIFDNFNLEQENFDPSLVPVSSIVTLAKVAQKLVNGNGTLTNPGNLQIGMPGANTAGNLTVTGNTTVSGTLGVTGASTLRGVLNVTGATTVGGTLGVSSNTTVGGTLGVTGSTTVGGTLIVTGSTTVGALGVINNTTVGGTLGVTGATTVGGTLGVSSNTTVGGTLGVTGATIVNNYIYAHGDSTSNATTKAVRLGELNDSSGILGLNNTLPLKLYSYSGNVQIGYNGNGNNLNVGRDLIVDGTATFGIGPKKLLNNRDYMKPAIKLGTKLFLGQYDNTDWDVIHSDTTTGGLLIRSDSNLVRIWNNNLMVDNILTVEGTSGESFATSAGQNMLSQIKIGGLNGIHIGKLAGKDDRIERYNMICSASNQNLLLHAKNKDVQIWGSNLSVGGNINVSSNNNICIGSTCINETHLKILTGAQPIKFQRTLDSKWVFGDNVSSTYNAYSDWRMYTV